MISAQNVKNNSYVILGLGRSGLSVAAALKAGGAKVLCLDDDPKYLKKAEELGFKCSLPDKVNWNEIDVLLVSPGIPHHYPEPHHVVLSAIENGVAIDNDIGVFLNRLAQWNGQNSM